jgi:hypothetical protein
VGFTADLVGEKSGKTLAHSGVRIQNCPAARSDLQYILHYSYPANKDIRSPFSKECIKRVGVSICNIHIGTVLFCSALQKILDAIQHIYDYSFVKSFPELQMFARHRTIIV